jgi:B12-binding domain/radical SAM domain protein of rhizo-twelve system
MRGCFVKVALVNPPWSFEGSIYSGCREPHLPLEFGYARALIEDAGHEAVIVDAQLEGLRDSDVRRRLEALEPSMTVVNTAPSYLFWHCAPPELRVPQQLVAAVREVAGTIVVVGPHGSTTPRATLRKLGAHVAVLGECEQVLQKLAATPRSRWAEIESIAVVEGARVRVQGGPAATDVTRLPSLRWSQTLLERHLHHHFRVDRAPARPGAEVEASRGSPGAPEPSPDVPLHDVTRGRPLDVVLREIEALAAQGAEYVYFVDPVFLPDRALLEALCEHELAFGIRTRIEHWREETLDLLGRAGCVSIEANVHRLTGSGRRERTETVKTLLVHARQRVPFVQANLVAADDSPPDEVVRLRRELHLHGVYASEPLPTFPYPGSSDYVLRWGPPDDDAWERAHAHYLANFRALADVRGSQPLSLSQLELPDAG